MNGELFAPVSATVETIQLTKDNLEDCVEFNGRKRPTETVILPAGTGSPDGLVRCEVALSRGNVLAREGDWIVKFHNGAYIILTDKDFRENYQQWPKTKNP